MSSSHGQNTPTLRVRVSPGAHARPRMAGPRAVGDGSVRL